VGDLWARGTRAVSGMVVTYSGKVIRMFEKGPGNKRDQRRKEGTCSYHMIQPTT